MTQHDQTWAEHLSEPQRQTLQTLGEKGYTFDLQARRSRSDEGFVMNVVWNDPLTAKPMRQVINGKLIESPQIALIVYIVNDASSNKIGLYFDDLVGLIQIRDDKL